MKWEASTTSSATPSTPSLGPTTSPPSDPMTCHSPGRGPTGSCSRIFLQRRRRRRRRSLNGIRAALENLEDQLEIFNTLQVQQRAEKDAAIARFEQSRILLARKLSEHYGKKYEVIEEALAFVGNADQLVSTNCMSAPCLPVEKSVTHKITRLGLVKVIVSSFDFAKRSLHINGVGGLLGNAALVAFSMLPLLRLRQTGSKDKYVFGLPQKQENAFYLKSAWRNYQSEDSSSINRFAHLDVTLARG